LESLCGSADRGVDDLLYADCVGLADLCGNLDDSGSFEGSDGREECFNYTQPIRRHQRIARDTHDSRVYAGSRGVSVAVFRSSQLLVRLIQTPDKSGAPARPTSIFYGMVNTSAKWIYRTQARCRCQSKKRPRIRLPGSLVVGRGFLARNPALPTQAVRLRFGACASACVLRLDYRALADFPLTIPPTYSPFGFDRAMTVVYKCPAALYQDCLWTDAGPSRWDEKAGLRNGMR
jgi:hypothetical protein